MTAPIAVHADFDADAYEITYRSLPEGTFIVHDVRVAPGVTAGLAPDGEIVGIELFGLERKVVAAAREYAAAHGLAFPEDIGDVPVGT